MSLAGLKIAKERVDSCYFTENPIRARECGCKWVRNPPIPIPKCNFQMVRCEVHAKWYQFEARRQKIEDEYRRALEALDKEITTEFYGRQEDFPKQRE